MTADPQDMEEKLERVERDIDEARHRVGEDKPAESPTYIDPGTGLEKAEEPIKDDTTPA